MFGREQFYQMSAEQSGLRLPKTLPKCLGRGGDGDAPGVTIPASISKQPAAAATQANKKPTQPASQVQTQKPQQRYIPGLNNAEDPHVYVPPNSQTAKHLPKEVPVSLVESFLAGSKQPISALMEYAALTKIVCVFEEVAVDRPSLIAQFAIRAKLNGKPFPQGTGKTKKEAKTAAAKIAFSMLLGLEEADVEDDEGRVLFDTLGRKMVVMDRASDFCDTASVASSTVSKMSLITDTTFAPKVALPSTAEAGVTPLWDAPTHPVSQLTMYCSLKYLDLSFVISNKPTDIGFRADALICEQVMGTGYATTKKEAKKKAAENTIAKLCPHFLDKEVSASPAVPLSPSQMVTQVPSGVPLLMSRRKKGVVQVSLEEDGNYVGLLQEFCGSRKIPMELEVSDTPGPEGFEAKVLVNSSLIAVAVADMKKDAKRLVAERALERLQGVMQKPKKSSDLEKLSLYDRLGVLSHTRFTELLAPTGEKSTAHKYIAAFVVCRDEDDAGEVVALGSGNGSISGANRAQDGRVLNDCHSVVVAKRSLMKYFHSELKTFHEGNTTRSIFEAQVHSPLLKLKSCMSIHLYMSRAPCGDVGLYTTRPDKPLTSEDLELMGQGVHHPSFPDDMVGFTSVKHETGFGVTLAMEQPAKWGGMSCSDKILKWNVVGLQGTLFSHFLAPVYLSSVTLGSLYDHGNLTRGICCRIGDELLESLPEGYRLNHPYVGRVTPVNTSLAANDICIDSINWTLGDEMIEIVNSVTGKSCDRSPFQTGPSHASRLSKAGFLFRFREIARLAKMPRLLVLEKYSDAKQASRVYQQAKHALVEHMETTGFGFWVRKPPGLELFTK